MLLEISDDEIIDAGSAAALTNKLLQLCNGAVYDENRQTFASKAAAVGADLQSRTVNIIQNGDRVYNNNADIDRDISSNLYNAKYYS